MLRFFHAPPIAQDSQQPRREHDVAIFLSLALLTANDHPLTVNVADEQADDFGDTESGGIASGQDRAMFDRRHAVEKL
jgi:hypothetical protein